MCDDDVSCVCVDCCCTSVGGYGQFAESLLTQNRFRFEIAPNKRKLFLNHALHIWLEQLDLKCQMRYASQLGLVTVQLVRWVCGDNVRWNLVEQDVIVTTLVLIRSDIMLSRGICLVWEGTFQRVTRQAIRWLNKFGVQYCFQIEACGEILCYRMKNFLFVS